VLLWCRAAKAAALLGAQPEELAGKPVDEWCTRREVRTMLARFGDPANLSAYSAQVEYSLDDNPDRRTCVAAYPLFSPRDRSVLFGMLVLFRDVSEQYLARQAGMEFVAQVSHELKTPLTTIATFSELLLDYAKLSAEDRVEAVNGIHGEVGRAVGLITNLLNVFKLEAGTLPLERQRVKINDLLADAVQSMRRSSQGREVELELKIPPDLGSARLDKDLFRIAIDNLVGNAIKYGARGGWIGIEARRAGGEVGITISDRGIGIAPADQQRIFEPFYRADDVVDAQMQGAGLGLSLVLRIVQAHGGRIAVKSAKDAGSQFTVFLPVGTGQTAGQPSTVGADAAAPASHLS
jgi:two-component system sensor histidine kinase VicK